MERSIGGAMNNELYLITWGILVVLILIHIYLKGQNKKADYKLNLPKVKQGYGIDLKMSPYMKYELEANKKAMVENAHLISKWLKEKEEAEQIAAFVKVGGVEGLTRLRNVIDKAIEERRKNEPEKTSQAV
jgi:hypothetical protein